MRMMKKISTAVLLVISLGMFSCEDPTSPTSEYTVTVSGQVVRVNNTGLDSVIVTLQNPLVRDTVSSDGSFGFSFTSTEKTEVSTTISFRHQGLLSYRDTSLSVRYSSTLKTIALGEVEMKGVTSAQDSVVTGKPSARAGAIFFVAALAPTVAIKGSGGTETSNILFEVRDSLGVPVDQSNATTVLFKIKSSSILGVQLNVDSAKTASNGQVTVQLRSGARTGMAQVQAMLKSDTTIKSPIVSIPIHGGLPDSSHFSIGVEQENLPGIKFGQSTPIRVLVGDRFGNPVQPGTPISFTTTGGIVEPFGVTGADGELSVLLKTGNPVPSNGIARVTAEIPISSGAASMTKKSNTRSLLDGYRKSGSAKSASSTFSRSVDVLFSGQSTITFSDNNFVIPVQTERTFSFRVSDPLGHPLSEGSVVKVLGFGLDSIGVMLTGDVDRVLPDTKDAAWTQFSFVVSDKRTTNLSQSKQINLAIEVTSPNGNVKRNITGYLGFAPVDTSGIPITSRQPAQIAFISSSASSIYVSGVGGTETSTLTYEVRDSLGVPIDLTRRVGASFSLQFIPNSFTPGGTTPTIIPAVDSSDNQGRVRVTIVSGTQAGIVQVITNVQVNQTKIITSQPIKVSVHAGFPDQNHFTISATNYNFPGLDRVFQKLPITVGVTDQHSNPVIQGTAVYFNSTHGTITTGDVTDVDGIVSAELLSANPFPNTGKTLPGMEPGYTRVYARTVGKNGVQVLDSITVLWTGAPIITNTGVDTFTVPNGGSRGPFTFTVRDRYNHPMSSGTTILVTSTAGSVVGNNEVSINFDTFSTGDGITSFTVYLEDEDNEDVDPAVQASIFVKVTHPVYGAYTLKLASGTVD